jgi:xanthine dehydrogenase YagR molybdenum-binding subunit
VKSAYGFPAVKVAESDVFTHLGPGCAMRAPGHPQGCFAVETALEELATRLGMDPLALRLKNDPSEVRRLEWETGAKEFGWSRRAEITKANAAAAASGKPLRRGLGCAASLWYTFVAPGSQVLVRIHRDGTVEVENGVQDIGGGPRTPIAMVVAEELGLPVGSIRVKIGDSRYPYGPASGGSVTTGSLIPAVRAAAVHAREKLVGAAAKVLAAPEAEVKLAEGVFSAQGRAAEFRKVCSRLPGETLVATGDRAKDYDGTDTRLFGAQFAEVVVDVETGVVAVKKVVAVHDCGQPVWRTGVESQIRGGILQGISYALFEERVVDERSGRVMNPNVEFYKVLGSMDTPEIVPLLVDLYPGKNNAHARGIGEPATVPTAAAVANAIAHATGVRPTSLPITPAKILALLGKVPAREVRA